MNRFTSIRNKLIDEQSSRNVRELFQKNIRHFYFSGCGRSLVRYKSFLLWAKKFYFTKHNNFQQSSRNVRELFQKNIRHFYFSGCGRSLVRYKSFLLWAKKFYFTKHNNFFQSVFYFFIFRGRKASLRNFLSFGLESSISRVLNMPLILNIPGY